MNSLRVIKELLLLQWRSFYRQPGVLFWALAFPIILSGLLGVAFAKKQTPPSPVMFLASPQDRPKGLGEPSLLELSYGTREEAGLAVKRGKVVLAVENPFDPKARRFLMDVSNPEAELAMRRAQAWLDGKGGLNDQVRPIDAKGSRYIDFVIPGLFASSIINSCLWGAGWMLIDFRQKKFMRRMVATPMRKRDFFASLFLGRILLNALEFCTLFAFAILIFGVEMQGSWAAFLACYFSGAVAFFGLGCLVASRTSSPQVGIGIINAITLPMFVISGMFFSYERFPGALQPLLRSFPPTMMVDALRAVMNEGAGLAKAAPACLALTAMGIFCMALARRIFKWH